MMGLGSTAVLGYRLHYCVNVTWMSIDALQRILAIPFGSQTSFRSAGMCFVASLRNED